MLVVYDSLTGLGKQFAEKLGYPTCDISSFSTQTEEPVFLITRSFNFGNIPTSTADFLLAHSNKVFGVAVTGNKIWGQNYGAAGYKIEQQYQIPLVHVFEHSGFPSDVEKVRQWIEQNAPKLKRKKVCS